MVTLRKAIGGMWSLDDLPGLMKPRLPKAIWAWAGGGSEREEAGRRNDAAFSGWALQPMIANTGEKLDAGIELFGDRYAMPVGIAPMGGTAGLHRRADLALARGAARAGIGYTLGSLASLAWEQGVQEHPAMWAQLYMPQDPAILEGQIARLRAAGTKVLVLTVDLPVMANAAHARRQGWGSPTRLTPGLMSDALLHPRWLLRAGLPLVSPGAPRLENAHPEIRPPLLSFGGQAAAEPSFLVDRDALARVRVMWPGKLVLKGVLHPQSARMAADLGVDGLIVSNHGGRALDYAIGSLAALPAIVAAVPDVPVLVDGGFRRGTHVLMALALGARMVLVGRPFLFAAAMGGEAGVTEAAAILQSEFERSLALIGARTCRGITREMIAPVA